MYVLYIAKTIAVQNQVNLKKSMKLIPLCWRLIFGIMESLRLLKR